MYHKVHFAHKTCVFACTCLPESILRSKLNIIYLHFPMGV